LKAVEKSGAQIQEKRALYQTLAVLASALYFSIDSLHPMYRFSLSKFNKLFVSAFAQFTDTDDRVRKIIMKFSSLTYSYFSRSLFREHRLVFGLSL
jgi:dynein heavy chain 2